MRVPMLGLDGLPAPLDDMHRLLKFGEGTTAPRHLTLRDVVEWSHGLLDGAEQRLFRRLGIFPCSFSIEDAAAIVGEDLGDPGAVLDLLFSLENKALLTVEAGSGPRFRLWETHRLYALERLAASGERETLAGWHAWHLRTIFDRAESLRETMLSSEWLQAYLPYVT